MNRYSNLEKTIYSVFGTDEWKYENISTYPSNFIVPDISEYLRISVIPSGTSINPNSLSGIVIIDIFTRSNSGTKRIHEVCDTLDKYLHCKEFKNIDGSVQFFTSTLSLSGQDGEKPSLFRSLYTINFNFYIGN